MVNNLIPSGSKASKLCAIETPLWLHDCSCCRFLGSYIPAVPGAVACDLYRCDVGKAWVMRFGSDPQDNSSRAFDLPIKPGEGYSLARELWKRNAPWFLWSQDRG